MSICKMVVLLMLFTVTVATSNDSNPVNIAKDIAGSTQCGDLKKLLALCPSWPEDFGENESEAVFQTGASVADELLQCNQGKTKLPLVAVPHPCSQIYLYDELVRILPQFVYSKYPAESGSEAGTHTPDTVYYKILWIMGYNIRALRLNGAMNQIAKENARLQSACPGEHIAPVTIEQMRTKCKKKEWMPRNGPVTAKSPMRQQSARERALQFITENKWGIIGGIGFVVAAGATCTLLAMRGSTS
ncbi:MAG: hypothetical protein LBL32_02060 [Holosporales bacterium]|jgi:hypothetical protein|nr:hypothetical protein [Holosporales bacterium]